MSPILFLSALAIVAGALFPIQTAVNARLAAVVGGPFLATLISFASGLVALSIIVLSTTRQWPALDHLRQQPPWLFVAGGCLGAAYLSMSVFLVPRIGSGAMMALAIAGQMMTALVIDRMGLLGLVVRDLTAGRVIGAIFVVFGALMVRFL